MSTISDNPLLIGATGKFANVFVYRRVRGKVIMAKKPRASADVSEKQRAARKTFGKATGYAKHQLKNPEGKRLYAEGINLKKHSAYLVAISDYLNAPTVDSVDLTAYTGAVGQRILIDASDDFRVAAVSVAIQGPDGVEIEAGAAKAPEELSDKWSYVTTAANAAVAGSKVLVRVSDVAGNVTVATFDK